jgi:ribosomal protein S12 methylthiotransferase
MAADTVHIVTLGCSKNTVDSEVVAKALSGRDWTVAAGDASEAANGARGKSASGERTKSGAPAKSGERVALINTCGFIGEAKLESIETILAAVEKKRRGEYDRVVVMGCLSERYAAELRAEIPGIDLLVGANKMGEVVDGIAGAIAQGAAGGLNPAAPGAHDPYFLQGERQLSTPSHYAYLKISEGCDRPCAFCAIPIMRGGHVSKPRERVITEARRLAALGVKEIVLIAQDSTYYGLDTEGRRTIAGLLRELEQVEGIEWYRLMYAFPSGFPTDLVDEMARNRKVCRYLDMPLQHVSDNLLASMRRGHNGREIRALLRRIRETVPGIALRTTLIVGYPGEGEKEFAELEEFVAESRFDRLGVFEYSQEEGTGAYNLGDPVPADLKTERRERIMEIQREISAERNAALVGSTLKVLIDERKPGAAVGRTEFDAPEVDNEVHVQGEVPPGHFCMAKIVDAVEYDLIAVPAV